MGKFYEIQISVSINKVLLEHGHNPFCTTDFILGVVATKTICTQRLTHLSGSL
jgi:hypothetical protein